MRAAFSLQGDLAKLALHRPRQSDTLDRLPSPHLAVERTARNLGLRVPSALRASAAGRLIDLAESSVT